MNNVFSAQVLAEKLSKLNNSQQSIETLSHWCIYHRKKAKQVVETWEKLFNSSPKEQRVPFLYLANDILQNGKRKGNEFVNDFWKVLPKALKNVFENGDEHGKNVVIRLVDIWVERKVFGSRGRGLKDEIHGKEGTPLLENNEKSSPPPLQNNGKSSDSIKVVKKDAHYMRLKLAVGGMPEKIVTAYQSVHEEHFNEDTALNKCKAAVRRVGKMVKDVDDSCSQGNEQGSALVNELREQETILKQCIEQLESVKETRVVLASQLREALLEQESKLELIHTQLQVAQAEKEHVIHRRQRLASTPVSGPSLGCGSSPSPSSAIATLPTETASAPEPNMPIHASSTPQVQRSPSVTSFASSMTTAEEQHKKAAAEVAAKLAASTSSAQMLTSVLSSLVAEEAASMNGGLKSGSFTTSSHIFPLEKRPKLDKPVAISDIGNTYFGHMQQQQLASIPLSLPQSSGASLQPVSQTNTLQPPFPPPLPPPPQLQQYVQTSGVMVGVSPYGFGNNALPPPPPPPSHVLMSPARPSTPQPPLPQQQLQQQSVATGFYGPGIGFYGQPSMTPPVPRQ